MRSINAVTIVGHLGRDVRVSTMKSGKKVATFSVATDHSYKKDGQWVNRAEWHNVVTYQEGLIGMLEKHARKGRLVAVQGALRTRKWTKDGVDRWTTEIIVSPGSQIQFLDSLKDRATEDMPQEESEQPPADHNEEDIPF